MFLLHFLLVLHLFFHPFWLVSAIYSCKSPSGQDVDWFVAYKLPSGSSNPRDVQYRFMNPDEESVYHESRINAGTAFLYADSQSQEWHLSGQSIAERESAIGRTILQIFEAQANQDFFITYNDNCPPTLGGLGSRSDQYGHMKGVLVSGDAGGFWMTHSIPSFPTFLNHPTTFPINHPNNFYEYPNGAPRMFGQSLLCINFRNDNGRQLTEILEWLHLAEAQICNFNVPPHFPADNPIHALIRKHFFTRPRQIKKTLLSRNRKEFTVFFKNTLWEEDLYSGEVANNLRVPLVVQSWRPNLRSTPMRRNTYNVFNVDSMRFVLHNPPMTIQFSSAADHSKWAVANFNRVDTVHSWICIGDLDRHSGQANRGGGLVCFKQANVASLYFRAINAYGSDLYPEDEE